MFIFSEGETCLFTAVRAGNKNVVRVLLEHGAKHDLVVNGKTPLEIAQKNNNTALIELLSEIGNKLLFFFVFVSELTKF